MQLKTKSLLAKLERQAHHHHDEAQSNHSQYYDSNALSPRLNRIPSIQSSSDRSTLKDPFPSRKQSADLRIDDLSSTTHNNPSNHTS